MPEVITFVNFRPPVRADSLPWTEARIWESATEEGTYVQIDVLALSPLDADPLTPAYRTLTTELGTAEDYWYQIEWADADGDTSVPTVPVQNTTGVSTSVGEPYGSVDELARILKVSAVTYAVQLEEVLVAASGEINAETGRTSTDFVDWETALANQVALERAVEHWHVRAVGFGIVGLDSEAPVRLASNSWERHANKLAPLKDGSLWGFA